MNHVQHSLCCAHNKKASNESDLDFVACFFDYKLTIQCKMRSRGLEPPRVYTHYPLKIACLPFHHDRADSMNATNLPNKSTIRSNFYNIPSSIPLVNAYFTIASKDKQSRSSQNRYCTFHSNIVIYQCILTCLLILAFIKTHLPLFSL